VRARLTDPLGPLWRRVLPGVHIDTRDVDVQLGDGSIAFRDQLVLRTIHARDVLGAFTAPTLRGFAVTLVLPARGRRPLTLEVADGAEAANLRLALGIGDGAFGELGLPTDRSVASDGERALRSIAAVFAGFGAVAFAEASPRYLIAVAPLVALTFVAIARSFHPFGVVLAPRGLRIRVAGGWDDVDLANVRFVYAAREGLRFEMVEGHDRSVGAETGGWVRERPSHSELVVVAAQIEAAANRAR
jgi:hypothetical protein